MPDRPEKSEGPSQPAPFPQPATIPPPAPITVSATATRAVLVGLVTRALVFAGGILVAHGVATNEMVAQAVGPVAQQIVGVIITAGGTAWGAWYAKHRQSKLITMASAVPSRVAIVR